ncbi:serine hydrolase domain-containing protein [Spirillospora sp. NPDC048911]|uniref:serine hydrolase domain-containing protein n=1 Tax=Spirillospora sp. NPDC048911 TaxID=3364527 RepID=UPI00371A3B90
MGFSKAGLDRMHDVLAGHVERGAAPGLVSVVCRHGEAHVDPIGAQAVGGAPMRADAIFRITSMTKPVTAVATLILAEECLVRLDEPVDRLLPELAGRRVLRTVDGPLDDTVPAHRPITVRDLLTFRMGFGLLLGPGTDPISRAAAELRLNVGPPVPAIPHTPDEWLRRLGTLPLMAQPGERWIYNTGSHVLGVLIARASGQPLETFLRERVFEPLGMKDTGFHVPADKAGRFAAPYEEGLVPHDDGGQWLAPPVFPDGAAGLVSTAADYLAFSQMLLNKGERILSRLSVEAMTTDQLTPAQKAVSDFAGLWDTRGWGFGVSVVTKRDGISAVPGRYGWDGGYGTSWSADPAEDMSAILMTQRLGFPAAVPLQQDFWTTAYAAIAD